jgi:hypothetical protein
MIKIFIMYILTTLFRNPKIKNNKELIIMLQAHLEIQPMVIFLNSQAWWPMAATLTTEELQARWAWICCQLRHSYLFLGRFYLKNKTLKTLSGVTLKTLSGVMALLECLSISCNGLLSVLSIAKNKNKSAQKNALQKKKIPHIPTIPPTAKSPTPHSILGCLTPPVLLPFHTPSYHCFFKA